MLAQTIRKILFPLFIVCLCIVPLSIETNLGGILPAQIVFLIEPIACISCGLLIVLSIISWKSIHWNTLDKLVALYVFATLLSTLFSQNTITSAKYSVTIIWYISVGYVLPKWLLTSRKKAIKIGTKSYLIGICLLAIYVLVQLFRFGIFFESSYIISNPFIPQGHSNLSIVLEPALILSFILCLFYPQRQKLFASLFVILLAIIMYSCSRASYLSLGILTATSLIFLNKRHKIYFLKLGVFSFALGLGLWYAHDYVHYLRYKDADGSFFKDKSLYYDSNNPKTYKHTSMFNEIGAMDKYKKDRSNNERVERWKAGLSFWKENIWTGIGVGTYPDKYLEVIQQQKNKGELNELQLRRMNMHNLYLSWLVEGGLLLALAGLSIITYLIWQNIRYIRSKKYSLFKIALGLYTLSFLFHGVGQDFSQEPRVIILFWILLAIYPLNRKDNKVKSSK
ncbi:MAG: O-antigen ligase family protein [Cytophagales bacterium]|nr:O-antigen ligase family protein [Cytophagales bacterium]